MRPFGRPPERGFTLLELMAVVLLMGTILLLVPMNMDTVGAEGKLKNTSNSLVAAVNGARDRAVLDSYDVFLELGTFRKDDEWEHGWRFKFTSLPPPEVSTTEDAGARAEQRAARAREREWLYTEWHETNSGVKIVGISERKGNWHKVSEGGEPYSLRFYADGTVESGLAVRLENIDMETEKDYRTITVFVNSLTSEPSWVVGQQELPEALPSSNFGN